MRMINIKRLFTKLFYCLPINDNKIFFSSYEGKQFSCNPKYIYIKIYEHNGAKKTYIWEYNKKENKPNELLKNNVKCVKHNSILYFYHIMTSRLIITNSGITANIALRKSQIQVNTWHGGGAYKKVGAVIREEVNGTSKENLKIAAEQTTYFLSSSKMFSKIMQASNFVDGKKYLEIGMPRNDILFNAYTVNAMSEYVKNVYNISLASKIVLFAPTYRGNVHDHNKMVELPCVSAIVNALKTRFGGDWCFLVRAHYVSDYIKHENDGVINVTDYPDMQELLCATDVLITDYSSSIWDFSFTYRPCFLFVPDLDEYENNRGGFYTSIHSWPGIVAVDNKELCQKIEEFNEDDYINKIEAHKKALGSVESGNSTVALLKILKI